MDPARKQGMFNGVEMIEEAAISLAKALPRELWVVLNILDVQCPLPTELVPGHFLRRPTAFEIENIRQCFRQVGRAVDLTLPFETNVHTGERLEVEEFLYLVVDPQDRSWTESVNGGVLAIAQASSLTDAEIDCSLCIYGNGGYSYGGYREMDPFKSVDFGWSKRKSITMDVLSDIAAIHRDLQRVTQKYSDVKRSLELFRHANALPTDHLLQLLGYFAVIESLLTHSPSGETDSLTRQIRTKIPLLDRRLQRSLDYSTFGETKPEKVWTKLYSFRSRIAHGGEINFASDFQTLRDIRTAAAFLRRATKAVLRHALVEPDLVLDLRAC